GLGDHLADGVHRHRLGPTRHLGVPPRRTAREEARQAEAIRLDGRGNREGPPANAGGPARPSRYATPSTRVVAPGARAHDSKCDGPACPGRPPRTSPRRTPPTLRPRPPPR